MPQLPGAVLGGFDVLCVLLRVYHIICIFVSPLVCCLSERSSRYDGMWRWMGNKCASCHVFLD